jgi:putative tributyrin esterase
MQEPSLENPAVVLDLQWIDASNKDDLAGRSFPATPSGHFLMIARRLLASGFLVALVLAPWPAESQTLPVKTVTMEAPSIGRKTAYNIILPANYETSGDKRYPVLYLLHGLSGNYTNWAGMGAARAAKGLELIVVMPDGGNSWYVNWAESEEGQKNAWDDFITKDLIGHVDANYRTIAAREGRAINGLSMGGFGGLTLGLRHPDLFCSIGSHSGALTIAKRAGDRLRSGQEQSPRKNQASSTPNERIQIEGFRSQAERTPKGKLFIKPEDADAADPFKLVLAVPKEKLPHIYVDCGTEDRLITGSRDFAKLLMEHNIPFVYGESPGAHNGQYWSREISTSVAVQYAVIRRALASKASEGK